MKRTLLDMVQTILSSLSAEEVNSIDDTVEALQVANILKEVYLELSTTRNWSEHKKLSQLDHSGTPERPTHLKAPENLKELSFFAYQASKEDGKFEMREVRYKYPDEFLRICSNRGINTPHTKLIRDVNGSELVIIDNKAPSYWTSFDDQYLVCDSYDSALDDALKASKTQIMASFMPTWETSDYFVPDLPGEAFSALVAEAKSVAFIEVKQVSNEKAEQSAQRQHRWLARKQSSLKNGVRYPNYGRRVTK